MILLTVRTAPLSHCTKGRRDERTEGTGRPKRPDQMRDQLVARIVPSLDESTRGRGGGLLELWIVHTVLSTVKILYGRYVWKMKSIVWSVECRVSSVVECRMWSVKYRGPSRVVCEMCVETRVSRRVECSSVRVSRCAQGLFHMCL